MINVRMYNVGFGDAILITVYQPAGPWRMLVDCGVHPSGASDHSMAGIVGQIIEDCGGALNLVVGTHRHRDHVSGFADPRWASVTVEEVWLPWTENRQDPEANALRQEQEDSARNLSLAFDASPELRAAVSNSLTNESAMATLESGFAGSTVRHYLPTTADPMPLTRRPAGLAAGVVHVLGPSHDWQVIKQMNPPKAETFRLAAGGGGAIASPFPQATAVSVGDYIQRYPALDLALPNSDRGRIINQAADRESGQGQLAVTKLEDAINNTSLVLALEVGKHVLLLPGDAQWGPWKAILNSDRSAELVDRTTFYKVSHHGSYNGTPRSLIGRLPKQKTMAGMSVHPVPQWTRVPDTGLMTALQKVTSVIRTDETTPTTDNAVRAADDSWVELSFT